MHEVQFEIEALARKQMLARMMPMELHQLVALAIDLGGLPGGGVDLDRVAVVDDLRALHRSVVELDARERCFDRALEVDRGLLEPDLASLEVSGKLAPVAGPDGALIAPMNAFGGVRDAEAEAGGADSGSRRKPERPHPDTTTPFHFPLPIYHPSRTLT